MGLGCEGPLDASFPSRLRALLESQRLSPHYRRTVLEENVALRRVAGSGDAPEILPGSPPLIVLTAGGALPDAPAAAAAWRRLHQRTASLSLRGEERLVVNAGHVIQVTHPEMVIDTARTLAHRARERTVSYGGAGVARR
ncbi:MAG: hypothetical protein M0D54_20150 [Hyphomonadaceae bacterium JAD_PAG50586_4]|nr:MAG: hypothetical protein M0D54_20150 [Hyphomonadaceae bacterium JAD_PAG50586_4]